MDVAEANNQDQTQENLLGRGSLRRSSLRGSSLRREEEAKEEVVKKLWRSKEVGSNSTHQK